MEADELVAESANVAAQTVGTDAFAKLAQHAVNLNSSEIGRHLSDDDATGIFSPVEVVKDGKDRLGAILALEGRAIIAWNVGTFRMKHFSTVVPRASMEYPEQTTRAGGGMTKDRDVLRISTDSETWTLLFANVFEGGQSIVPYLVAMLDGAIRPVFEQAE